MTLRRFSAVYLPILALSAFLAGPAKVAAQAVPAATKALDISVYGGYLNTNSDYGPYRNTGEAFGVDLTPHLFHFPIDPSLEFRINLTNGPAVAERTYLPGLRGTYNFHALHPYGTFLIGPGTIHFNFPNNGYQNDSSTVYDLGGGLNLDVYPNFQVMADFQYQHWNLGGSDTLTPTLFLFGVTYHIPFRPFNEMSGR